MHGEPATALGDHAGALEDGEEAAGGLAARAGELGELGLGGGDQHVLVTITQSDIAQLAGSSRESASRFLAVLERAGVVTQGRGRLTVHEPAALERYVY